MFTRNDRSVLYDSYNAYFEVQFQVQKVADSTGYGGTDTITVINRSLLISAFNAEVSR